MFRNLPSTKALKAFVITAQSLNITRAAQVLNLTQGAVSRQLTTLEDDLGIRLFSRHARGLELTDAGKNLLPEITRALENISLAIDQLAQNKHRIRLKAPSCISYWLMPRLNNFHSAHPDIDVELTSTTKHGVNFSTEMFDAAICFGKDAAEQKTVSYSLFDEVLTPMCTPELLAQRSAAEFLAELSTHPWLHASSDQRDWKFWLSEAGLKNIKSERNQTFPTLDLATSAAARGFGVVVGDIQLACHELDNGRLVAPLTLQVKTGQKYFLQVPQAKQNSTVDVLAHWLLQDTED